jgi:CDP-paratose 2-epimerase
LSRYLVTGGLGVIGSCMARRLIEAGHEVEIIDGGVSDRHRWTRERLIGFHPVIANPTVYGRIRYRPFNTSEDDCRGYLFDAVSECDAVIHAGASTGIPYSVTDPVGDWRENVEGTRYLLDALRNAPRPTVVLSSIKPYRVEPLPPNGLDESAVLDCDEPYAASKASQSMLCQAYARSYGVPVVTFRCSNLYGPAPCHGPRHGWLTWFAISAAIGRPLEVQGTGNQSRDMLHADDVFSACMAALEHADKLKGEVFNLGGGSENQITVGEAAALLRELTGVEVKAAPRRAMDDDQVFINYAKFAHAVGWAPRVKVEDGLREVLAWAQRHKAELAKIYEGVA